MYDPADNAHPHTPYPPLISKRARKPPHQPPDRGPTPTAPLLASKRVPVPPWGTGFENMILGTVRSTPETDRWCLRPPTTMRYR